MLKNTIINPFQESFMSMIEPMTFGNQQVSISNMYVTSDLVLLAIIIGKHFTSAEYSVLNASHILIYS